MKALLALVLAVARLAGRVFVLLGVVAHWAACAWFWGVWWQPLHPDSAGLMALIFTALAVAATGCAWLGFAED